MTKKLVSYDDTQSVGGRLPASVRTEVTTIAQPIDSDLTAIAALSTTTFGRSLLAQADAPTALGTLGGQPVDSDLTAIAALTTTTFGRSLLTQTNAGTLLTALGAQSANALLVHVDDHGSDPTGATYSDTAVAAAVAALGSSAGSIVFGPGVYKLANSVGTFGAGQSITGAGRAATTLQFHGTGDVIYVRGTSATQPPQAGVVYGLTIDGTNAGTGASSAGLHAGDIYGLKIDNVQIQGFGVTGSKGIWLDNRLAWMERGEINANVQYCATNVLFDGSSLSGGGFASFDYARYSFSIITAANQDGVVLQGKSALAGVDMWIVGNFYTGTTNTGSVLKVGTSGTDGSFLADGSMLNISVECDGTSGQVGHAAVSVGAAAYLIASGTLNFANYNNGNFQPGTISGGVGFTTLGGQTAGSPSAASRWIGMLGPCQAVTQGGETFTVASGSVTQIAGTSVNNGTYFPSPGDRILIPNAPASTGTGSAYSTSTQPANGIYAVVSNVTNLVLARAADMAWSVPSGLSVYVEASTGWNPQTQWTVVTPTAASAFTYGTTAMLWAITGGTAPTYNNTVGFISGANFYGGTYNAKVVGNSGAPGAQTLSLPATATSDTLVGRASTDVLLNKTYVPGSTITATAAGTTALTIASTQIQIFTGTTTQTVTLATTTVPAGFPTTIVNLSTGLITVNASGGTTVIVLSTGQSIALEANQATPTTFAHWTPIGDNQTIAVDHQPAAIITCPRQFATTDLSAAATKDLRLTYFTADKTLTLNNMSVQVGGTAAAATPTLCRFGVYSVAANGNLTLIGSTPNDTTLFASTYTIYTKALSSSVTFVRGQRYAIGILVVSTAALPIFSGCFPTMSLQAPILSSVINTQTDLPSTVTTGFGFNNAFTYIQVT